MKKYHEYTELFIFYTYEGVIMDDLMATVRKCQHHRKLTELSLKAKVGKRWLYRFLRGGANDVGIYKARRIFMAANEIFGGE